MRLADAVLAIHVSYVVFVVLGGFLLPLAPGLVWLHVPCVLYGGLIEIVNWPCPLTGLEKRLRTEAGRPSYEDGFLDRYFGGRFYPAGFRNIHRWLGVLILAWNAAIYGFLYAR